jgi:hypothetical protein
LGISADGFVATAEGLPTFLTMPGFISGESHGHTAFIERIRNRGSDRDVHVVGGPQIYRLGINNGGHS